MKQKHHLIFLLILCLAGSRAVADLPARFDLRHAGENNYVTTVKSQQGGTCWAHGTLAAMESNLLRTGTWIREPELSEPNLAEYHLDWWNGFNLFYNEDLGYLPGEGLAVHMGGDYRVAAAYLSRGDGAVRDEDGQSYKDPPARRDSSYQYFYPRDIEWYRLKRDLSNIAFIKNQLMTHGALATCMYANNLFLDDSTNGSFYQPPSDPNEPNHSIAIVGWDDTLRTAAPSPGAWLCKNSWGASWGSAWGGNGYFWISYYDKHAGRNPEMGCVSFQHVEPMRYDGIYYHDYHGWRDTLDVREAVNIFVAEARDTLVAVSFYTAADSVNYSVKVFRTRTALGNDSPVLTQGGMIACAGFHTLDLEIRPVLMSGDSFFVCLDLDRGGQAYDRTSVVPVLLDVPQVYSMKAEATTVPSRAEKNESLFRSGGEWIDLQTVNASANFCIKALVKKSRYSSQTPAPESSGLIGTYPNPAGGRITIDFQLVSEARVEIRLTDLAGRTVAVCANETFPAGYHWINWDVSGLSAGLYLCILSCDGQLTDTRKMLVLK
ncbi:MAG: T9SS type A sorting domain-containing protein [Candidatus Marinimicrobia bacterium]|nr:T9SS type A sorting domain-containing protein [Candidatus Neomarinimicrobiota bacterium]